MAPYCAEVICTTRQMVFAFAEPAIKHLTRGCATCVQIMMFERWWIIAWHNGTTHLQVLTVGCCLHHQAILLLLHALFLLLLLGCCLWRHASCSEKKGWFWRGATLEVLACAWGPGGTESDPRWNIQGCHALNAPSALQVDLPLEENFYNLHTHQNQINNLSYPGTPWSNHCIIPVDIQRKLQTLFQLIHFRLYS